MNLLTFGSKCTTDNGECKDNMLELLQILSGRSMVVCKLSLYLLREFHKTHSLLNDRNAFMVDGKSQFSKRAFIEARQLLIDLKVIERAYDKKGKPYYQFNAHNDSETVRIAQTRKVLNEATDNLLRSLLTVLNEPLLWKDNPEPYKPRPRGIHSIINKTPK